jgi:hypothetical protein
MEMQTIEVHQKDLQKSGSANVRYRISVTLGLRFVKLLAYA